VRVFAFSSICTFVVNLAKNLVSVKASAMLKADKCMITCARAITTGLGKSVTSAISFPAMEGCLMNSQHKTGVANVLRT
jgi:hypothetical protein